jgi:hypothetical protein
MFVCPMLIEVFCKTIIGADDVAESSSGWTKQEESLDQSQVHNLKMIFIDVLCNIWILLQVFFTLPFKFLWGVNKESSMASIFDCKVNDEPMFMILRRNKACSLFHFFVVLNLVGDTACKWMCFSICLFTLDSKDCVIPNLVWMWILSFLHAHRTWIPYGFSCYQLF